MPHSSGGGSSSGGSHSGSHRGRHISRKYYRGADRYVRYKKNGDMEIAYSHRHIGFLGKGINWLGLVLAGLAMYGNIIIGASAFEDREKIDVNSYQSEIFISDGANAISNFPKLGARLDEFQDLTGISICVKTVYDSEWKPESYDLESYAYNEYLRQFDDEYHWLLVYSVNDQKGKDKWSWEGMQGDNTDVILTEDYAEKFTKTVQKSLEKGESFDVAVEEGLDKISSDIMTKPDLTLLFGALMLAGIIIYVSYTFFIEGKTGNRTRYIRVPGEYDDKPVMKRCYSCGREYIEGTVKVCPYCYNLTRYKLDPFYRRKVNDELESFPH